MSGAAKARTQRRVDCVVCGLSHLVEPACDLRIELELMIVIPRQPGVNLSEGEVAVLEVDLLGAPPLAISLAVKTHAVFSPRVISLAP